jgi:hypothetical protein
MLDANENMSKSAMDLKFWVDKNSISRKKYFLPKTLGLNNFPGFVKERCKLLSEKLEDVLTLK